MDHQSNHRSGPPALRRPYEVNFAGAGAQGADDDARQGALGPYEYYRILRRRRGTLLICAVAGLLLGILLTLPQTPIYQAHAQLEIQDVNNDFLNTKQVNPVADDSSMDVLTDVQTQMKIIQSRQLADRVVKRLRAKGEIAPLMERTGRVATMLKALNMAGPKPAFDDYQLREAALSGLTVRELGQTRVVEVLYSSPNAQFAADYLNTLAAEYIDSNMEARWRMSERTGEWLTAQLDETRRKLEQSEAALQEYAQRSGLLFAGGSVGNSDKTNVADDKLRQLQEELSKAEGDRAAAESQYKIAQTAPAETVGDVLNDQNLRQLQAKLTDLRRQEADLAAVYTPKHEKVQRVHAQIAPLEAEFQTERNAIIARIKNDYDAALTREKLLTAAYNDQSKVVTEQASKSIQYNILKREVDSNRQIYESMLQQMKEASVASAIRASNIRVVDFADRPRGAYSPNMRTNAILGSFAGLLLGIAGVLIRERADRTLQQPGDAQLWTNVPELGVIPSAKLDAARKSYSDVPAERETRLPSKANSFGVELVTLHHKASVISESFRNVLTSILFMGENGARPRVLVLTSGASGDGKTVSVSNLAICAAEIRQKVLVIDADLRRPRVHDVFQVPNEQGLSTILRDDSIDIDRAASLVQPTSIHNLDVLTSGPATAAAAHLLYSPALTALIDKFRVLYDMILIDTPPSLDLTDARLIGRMADAVVIVTRAGRTTKEVATTLSRRFAEDHTRVIGTILNDWNPADSSKGYYGYYSAYYHKKETAPAQNG